MRELKNGELRVDRARIRAEEPLDGKHLLSPPDPSLSAEDVPLGYKQFTEVERSFRTLKSTLVLSPLYHSLPERLVETETGDVSYEAPLPTTVERGDGQLSSPA